jgi:hypothetical protein
MRSTFSLLLLPILLMSVMYSSCINEGHGTTVALSEYVIKLEDARYNLGRYVVRMLVARLGLALSPEPAFWRPCPFA